MQSTASVPATATAIPFTGRKGRGVSLGSQPISERRLLFSLSPTLGRRFPHLVCAPSTAMESFSAASKMTCTGLASPATCCGSGVDMRVLAWKGLVRALTAF